MEFMPYTLKWLELVLRWGHVLFAILWVGNSFLFNYLDNKLNKDISSQDIDGEGYLMHSGYYYKLTRLKNSPPVQYLSNLVIFKWQSYLTFITGILLLIIIYFYNSGVLMIDKRVLQISPLYAILISIASLLVSWFIYDLLCKSKLINNNFLFSLIIFILLIAISFIFTKSPLYVCIIVSGSKQTTFITSPGGPFFILCEKSDNADKILANILTIAVILPNVSLIFIIIF